MKTKSYIKERMKNVRNSDQRTGWNESAIKVKIELTKEKKVSTEDEHDWKFETGLQLLKFRHVALNYKNFVHGVICTLREPRILPHRQNSSEMQWKPIGSQIICTFIK